MKIDYKIVKRGIMSKAIRILIIILFVSMNSWALSPKKKAMRVLVLPKVLSEEKSDLSEKILPKTIDATEPSRTVVSKIVDNSLAYIWDRSGLNKSSVGRAAQSIDQKMKAEMNMGATASNPKGHKLSFKILAMQALAKLEYQGWVKAALNYDAKDSKAEAEFLESLSKNQDLVLSHSITKNENKSQLSLRWNW